MSELSLAGVSPERDKHTCDRYYIAPGLLPNRTRCAIKRSSSQCKMFIFRRAAALARHDISLASTGHE